MKHSIAFRKKKTTNRWEPSVSPGGGCGPKVPRLKNLELYLGRNGIDREPACGGIAFEPIISFVNGERKSGTVKIIPQGTCLIVS